MFRTNSLFKFIPCPKKKYSESCNRPYCQFSHDDNPSDSNFCMSVQNDFFSNLKPEDLEDYNPCLTSNEASITEPSCSYSYSNKDMPTYSTARTSDYEDDDLNFNKYCPSFGISKWFTNVDDDGNTSIKRSFNDIGLTENYDQKMSYDSKIDESEVSEQNPKDDESVNKKRKCESPTPSTPQKKFASNEPNKKASTNSNSSSAPTKRTINFKDEEDLYIRCKKMRIAHTANYDLSEMKKPQVNKKSPRQVLLERYAQNYNIPLNSKAASSASTSTNKTIPNNSTMSATAAPLKPLIYPILSSKTPITKSNIINHNSNKSSSDSSQPAQRYEVSTADKYTKRVAHPDNKSLGPNLYPKAVESNKIALKMRYNSLCKIYDELSSRGEASGSNQSKQFALEAQNIEKDICIRSKNMASIYLSLAASKVKSLRSSTSADGEAKPSTPLQNNLTVIKSGKNCSIVKRLKLTYKNLTSSQLVSILDSLIIPKDELGKYGFPIPGKKPNVAIFPKESKNEGLTVYQEPIQVTCYRCSKPYTSPQDSETICIYHSGRIYNYWFNGNRERLYSCCKASPNSEGCCMSFYHVTIGDEFADSREGFVRTIPSKDPQHIPKIFAIDCEMCFTDKALELSRVTLMDFECNVVFETLVKPKNKVIDYNTEYSGIKKGDLDNVVTTLEDVQARMLKLVSAQSYLIGHGLDSDFKVLKLFHDRVLDTTYLYPHKQGLPFKRSLKTLSANFLNKIIQDNGGGHDSYEDAKAALDLVKLALKNKLSKYDFSKSESTSDASP